MKVLVIQQKMIGDVLTSSIICEAIKKNNPNSEVHYLVHSNTIQVIKNHPSIDKIIEFKPEFRKKKIKLFQFLLKVRKQKYDKVIDVYGKLESNLISVFSGATQKISYKKWYTFFIYNKLITPKLETITNAGLAIENRLRLIFEENQIKDNIIKPKIFLSKSEIESAKKILTQKGVDLNKPLVMISVIGSSPNKTLPFEYMSKVIDEIIDIKDCTVLYNYIPPQAEEAKKVLLGCNNKTQESTRFDIFGKSLREFIAILYHCSVLIGNEGGAVNMAKALDKPTFTIFSPWILQHGWNLFEDGAFHKSVHLNQYREDLYKHKSLKELKENAFDLYSEFIPDLFLKELREYLKLNL